MNLKFLSPSLILFLSILLISCGGNDSDSNNNNDQVIADMVLTGGKVVTVDSSFSIAEAVAIKDGKIVFVGSAKDAEAFVDSTTQVLDMKGKFVMPGLHDSHCHPEGLGDSGKEDGPDNSVSLSSAKSFDEMVEIIGEKAKTLEPGVWIRGGGWSQEDWGDKQLPVHDKVSAVTPDNPVFLYRRGGNSAFVNAKAMELVDITPETPDPFGGKIYRKADGKSPTGFLTNMGNNLVHEHKNFPHTTYTKEEHQNVYLTAQETCHALGLTGWTDAGTSERAIQIYESLVDEGKLKMRSNVMLLNCRGDSLEKYYSRLKALNYGGEHMMQCRSIKVYYDGALGSRGAAFFEPYLDDVAIPDNTGNTEISQEHLLEVCNAALKLDMQVCPHAIGIRGNSEILDVFTKAFQANPDKKDTRFRSEHAEVVQPSDVKRMAEIGVIPSVQPKHHTSDMPFLPSRIGHEKCKTSASPWRNMLEAGLPLACGSDFTSDDERPLLGIHAAVTRKDPEGTPPEGWYPEQKMTREEAIKGYTIWAAYAAFWEDVLGSLEVGKYADITIFDTDLLECADEEILKAKVLYTIVNGEVVYQNEE